MMGTKPKLKAEARAVLLALGIAVVGAGAILAVVSHFTMGFGPLGTYLVGVVVAGLASWVIRPPVVP